MMRYVITIYTGFSFNFFIGGAKAQSCTLLLRGGAEQFIAETERSLHDAIMIVRRTLKNDSIVAGVFWLRVRLKIQH